MHMHSLAWHQASSVCEFDLPFPESSTASASQLCPGSQKVVRWIDGTKNLSWFVKPMPFTESCICLYNIATIANIKYLFHFDSGHGMLVSQPCLLQVVLMNCRRVLHENGQWHSTYLYMYRLASEFAGPNKERKDPKVWHKYRSFTNTYTKNNLY